MRIIFPVLWILSGFSLGLAYDHAPFLFVLAIPAIATIIYAVVYHFKVESTSPRKTQ